MLSLEETERSEPWHTGDPRTQAVEGTAVAARLTLRHLPWELLNGGRSFQLQLETKLLSKFPLNALGEPEKGHDYGIIRHDTSGARLTT